MTMEVTFLSMATKQITRNIALTPHFDRFVQSKVDSGRYQSASEVVRDGLRLLEEREERRAHPINGTPREIELGWQQSERGELLDGPRVFAEIRKMSKLRRASARSVK
jgi:antitoxin ParD1/3/4